MLGYDVYMELCLNLFLLILEYVKEHFIYLRILLYYSNKLLKILNYLCILKFQCIRVYTKGLSLSKIIKVVCKHELKFIK